MNRSLALGDVFHRLAELHGAGRLVEQPDPSRRLCLTYREAAERVGRLAKGIAARAGPGERVVLAMPNGYDQLLAAVAACRAGAVAVPVNAQMRPEEVDHVVADSEAALVVTDAEEVLGPSALGAAEVDARRGSPAAVAAIFYTSGTTGIPKGAELSHRGLSGAVGLAALWPSGLRRDEMITALPVAHIMGFAVLLVSAATGIPVCFMTAFRAHGVLDAIESRRATVFVGVPAMYRMLLDAGAAGRDLSSVRMWASGADVMPPELARRFQRMGSACRVPVSGTSIGDAAFLEGYGMVETSGAVALRLAPPGLAIPLPLPGGLLGLPLPGYHLRVTGPDGSSVAIGGVGELMVRGPGVLVGYHGDAAATSGVVDPDGWLHTGDLARRGPVGLVSFAGRAKDVIKSGGYSVYPLEVERAMQEHPEVGEAAAIGLPDERLGERTAVAVVLRAGATIGEAELLAWGAERLSGYKRPRAVRILAELPRTGTQKVAKGRLAALFGP